jgi:hypothetical protein
MISGIGIRPILQKEIDESEVAFKIRLDPVEDCSANIIECFVIFAPCKRESLLYCVYVLYNG